MDHFQPDAAAATRAGAAAAINFVDARRCTVQLENGHLYLDAIPAPARSLLGYDEPRSASLSAAEVVALIDAMSTRHRCVALTDSDDSAFVFAKKIVGHGKKAAIIPGRAG